MSTNSIITETIYNHTSSKPDLARLQQSLQHTGLAFFPLENGGGTPFLAAEEVEGCIGTATGGGGCGGWGCNAAAGGVAMDVGTEDREAIG